MNFSLSDQNCANFYPQFQFFVRQYLLHSVILVSEKAELSSHKKGGKTLCSKKKPSASEVDGVQYRRAQNMADHLLRLQRLCGHERLLPDRYGKLFCQHRLRHHHCNRWHHPDAGPHSDAFTDPMLAFVYDRVNTVSGKLRVLLISGYLIEAVACCVCSTCVPARASACRCSF